jgi:(p)ppGpp synthase/HD superfamily hydrolase
MLKQGVSFEEVFDNYAIRIIYKSDAKNEKFLAWKIYSIVTDVYHSNPSRMRDWITQPRSTGYESLHLTVLGPDKKWIEVQIRSERMDEIAEKGLQHITNTKKVINKVLMTVILKNGLQRSVKFLNSSRTFLLLSFWIISS